MTTFNIMDYGAAPTQPDSTDSIKEVINQMSGGDTLWIPPNNTFNINAGGIRLKNGTTIELGGTLQQIANAHEDWHRIIMLDSGVADIIIEGGGTLRGRRDVHVGDESDNGATGHNIDIREGSSNITIRGITTANAWGDGICFCQDNGTQSAGGPPKNVVIQGVLFDFNRRNGLSIISGDTVAVNGNIFKRTGQPPRNTPPYFGIDLECSAANQVCVNIIISKNQFIDNFDTNIGVGSPAGSYHNISITSDNLYDWRQQPIAITGNAGKLSVPTWAVIYRALLGWNKGYRYNGYPSRWNSAA